MGHVEQVTHVYHPSDRDHSGDRTCYGDLRESRELLLRCVPAPYVPHRLLPKDGIGVVVLVGDGNGDGILGHDPDGGDIPRNLRASYGFRPVGGLNNGTEAVVGPHGETFSAHHQPLTIHLERRPQPHQIRRCVIQPAVGVDDLLILDGFRLIGQHHLPVGQLN